MADWARQMAQMPYPGLKWMQTKAEMKVKEAMRLGSLVVNWGMSTPSVDRSFEAGRAIAITLLKDTIEELGDREDEKLRWAVGESPHGPSVLSESVKPSLKGLLAYLEGGLAALWVPEKELAATKELKDFSFILPGANWADEVEQEEQEQGVVPRQAPVPPTPIPKKAKPTHPVTERNDGRPPPTAFWGPDKPPRPRLPERAFGAAFPGERVGKPGIPGKWARRHQALFGDGDDFVAGAYSVHEDARDRVHRELAESRSYDSADESD